MTLHFGNDGHLSSTASKWFTISVAILVYQRARCWPSQSPGNVWTKDTKILIGDLVSRWLLSFINKKPAKKSVLRVKMHLGTDSELEPNLLFKAV